MHKIYDDKTIMALYLSLYFINEFFNLSIVSSTIHFKHKRYDVKHLWLSYLK